MSTVEMEEYLMMKGHSGAFSNDMFNCLCDSPSVISNTNFPVNRSSTSVKNGLPVIEFGPHPSGQFLPENQDVFAPSGILEQQAVLPVLESTVSTSNESMIVTDQPNNAAMVDTEDNTASFGSKWIVWGVVGAAILYALKGSGTKVLSV